MKIKLDENLPLRLADALRELGHEVHTLFDERLAGQADADIWEATQKEARFLITQDLDFSDLRKFTPGSHQGILIVVRLRSPNRRELAERIAELFQKENAGNWTGCFVVATERKIRVIRPGGKQNSSRMKQIT
jgi:predicted nuclease of predicted toxin-antitoxin system